MHSLANNGCTKVEMTEEEISNSDISQYENGKDLNKTFLGHFEKLNYVIKNQASFSKNQIRKMKELPTPERMREKRESRSSSCENERT